MVTGFTKFKEKFQGFEDQYVIIGGTACDLLMESENRSFRATKDIDIVLIVESITVEFEKAFWEYIKEAEYEHKNKSTGNAQFYRFTSPKSKEYPYMIEIFSRRPEGIVLDADAVLTPLPIDDEISSLSAAFWECSLASAILPCVRQMPPIASCTNAKSSDFSEL